VIVSARSWTVPHDSAPVSRPTLQCHCRLIAQPVQPPGQEPVPPLPHRGPADAQPRRHSSVAAALSAGQHDPRPQRQPLRGPPAPGPSLQRPPLGIGQHQPLQPRITHATSRSRAEGPVTTQPGPETKRDSRGDV
jgi:hypothetical protein